MRRLRWPSEPEPAGSASKRPLRDSALAYGALAAVVVAISAATGGHVLRSLAFAAAAWAVAVAYAWLRLRRRSRSDAPPAR